MNTKQKRIPKEDQQNKKKKFTWHNLIVRFLIIDFSLKIVNPICSSSLCEIFDMQSSETKRLTKKLNGICKKRHRSKKHETKMMEFMQGNCQPKANQLAFTST